jgi:hypothetical protein
MLSVGGVFCIVYIKRDAITPVLRMLYIRLIVVVVSLAFAFLVCFALTKSFAYRHDSFGARKRAICRSCGMVGFGRAGTFLQTNH